MSLCVCVSSLTLSLSSAHIPCQLIYPLFHSATPFFALSILSSLNHLLILCFSFSIFFCPLLILCHFICLCLALSLLSTFITPLSFLSPSLSLSLPLYFPLRLTPSFHVSSAHLTFHILIQLSLVLQLPLARFSSSWPSHLLWEGTQGSLEQGSTLAITPLVWCLGEYCLFSEYADCGRDHICFGYMREATESMETIDSDSNFF